MSNTYFLTNVPCDSRLNVGHNTHFYWDGKDKLVLSLKGGYRTSTLHFKPGDAFHATQNGNIVKLSKVVVPNTLSGVVLWTCYTEKEARAKTEEAFRLKLESFKSKHRIREPASDCLPVWKAEHRIKRDRCTGPFLFFIQEEKLQIVRYATQNGTRWATVAAYCDPDISKEEACGLIRKYGIVDAPQWYIKNAIHAVCGEEIHNEQKEEQTD